MNTQNLMPEIAGRYSPLAFSDGPVRHDDLMLLFEAAAKAPSGYNNQPWRFLYAHKEDTEFYPLFFDCLVDANKAWAFTAPVLALTMARMNFERNGKHNRFAWYEAGMAVGNLLTQAMSLGLYAHQMGGFDIAMAKKNLEIPDGFEPIAMMALGYPGDASVLPADLQERASKRTERKDVVKFVSMGLFPAEWR